MLVFHEDDRRQERRECFIKMTEGRRNVFDEDDRR